jgi:hypothetical protein
MSDGKPETKSSADTEVAYVVTRGKDDMGTVVGTRKEAGYLAYRIYGGHDVEIQEINVPASGNLAGAQQGGDGGRK